MANRAQNLKDQVGQLWRGAVAQAEGVRDQFRTQTQGAAKRVRGEIDRLRNEREQLVSRLGEQTLSWVNANRSAVPGPLKPTVEKLNRVIERLVKHDSPVTETTKKATTPKAAVTKTAAPKMTVKHTVVKRAPAQAKAPAAKKKTAVATKPAAKISKQPVSRKVLRDEEPA